MQMFENLPWYGYAILALGIISYAYKYFRTAKEGYDEADLKTVKFKKSQENKLSETQEFALALYTPIAEWFGADTNSLFFVNEKKSINYLKRWRIDTPQGYWDLTEYFIKDGRRWYFDFIYHMIQNEPEEKWDELMNGYFGDNDRASRFLKNLKNNKVPNMLKQKGFLTFDSEMDLGIVGYDAALLVGQARKAFTAGIISEEEAWKVINTARELAQKHFSSWEQFGKSFILGFALDQQHREKSYREEIYHLYNQVVESADSPWNTINWKD